MALIVRPDLYAPGSTYHQQRRWTHVHAVRCLETAMELLGTPRSLLDVGCAEGALVAWALEHDVEAMGIDLAAPANNPALVRADLCHPIDVGRQFEWVLCWEVAEHLPAAAAETLVETLVRHMLPAGRILFTAARPGQRGPGHVHCQPPIFWHRLFMARGLTYAAGLSAALKQRWVQCAPRAPWYGRNVSVYWMSA